MKLKKDASYDVIFKKRVKGSDGEYHDEAVVLADNIDAATTQIVLEALKKTGDVHMGRVRRRQRVNGREVRKTWT